MSFPPNRVSEERGAALLLAIGLLALFAMMGTAYVTYMGLEAERAREDGRSTAARQFAQAGFHAAVGELAAELDANGSLGAAGSSFAFEFPVYEGGRGEAFQTSETVRARVSVDYADEMSRVNLNAAPPVILEYLLGVDTETAEAIAAALPPEGGPRWLASVDDIAVRGLIDAEALEGLPRDDITVHSAADQAPDGVLMNVNTVSRRGLEAAFNLIPEEASAVEEGRPYETVEQLEEALGRSLSETPAAGIADRLVFESRLARLTCVASVEERSASGEWHARRTRRIETVAWFPPDAPAGPIILYWRESGPADSNDSA
ncbi:MAG: hypothetical protein ACLFU6_06050 [Candidatus Hydrogenedentota bacterium]